MLEIEEHQVQTDLEVNVTRIDRENMVQEVQELKLFGE